MADARRRIGAVVETPALYTDMTAEDNLRQQCLILGLPSFGGIPDLLKLVGLENTGRKKVRHFSLGMKQRLGIALALSGDPDLLEPDQMPPRKGMRDGKPRRIRHPEKALDRARRRAGKRIGSDHRPLPYRCSLV